MCAFDVIPICIFMAKHILNILLELMSPRRSYFCITIFERNFKWWKVRIHMDPLILDWHIKNEFESECADFATGLYITLFLYTSASFFECTFFKRAPLDNFPWSYLKSKFYKSKPQNLDDLRNRIISECRATTPEIHTNVRCGFQNRFYLCLKWKPK